MTTRAAYLNSRQGARLALLDSAVPSADNLVAVVRVGAFNPGEMDALALCVVRYDRARKALADFEAERVPFSPRGEKV